MITTLESRIADPLDCFAARWHAAQAPGSLAAATRAHGAGLIQSCSEHSMCDCAPSRWPLTRVTVHRPVPLSHVCLYTALLPAHMCNCTPPRCPLTCLMSGSKHNSWPPPRNWRA